jgi:large subunit ribosomal protein LP2
MRYIAAYVLLVLGGKANPSVSQMKAVLEAGGVSVDEARMNEVMAALKGKNINELIAEGKGMMAAVPTGAGAAPAAAAGAAAGGAAAAPAAEAKKEEPEEESDDVRYNGFS